MLPGAGDRASYFNDMAELHVRVTGLVQGVGFRWFVREQARRLGLDGWVRNHADGSVEVLAQGDADQLDLLRRALERGPDGARVSSVDVLAQAAPEPGFHPFGILK